MIECAHGISIETECPECESIVICPYCLQTGSHACNCWGPTGEPTKEDLLREEIELIRNDLMGVIKQIDRDMSCPDIAPSNGHPVAPSIEPTVDGRKCEPSGTCLDNGLQPLVERLLDHGAEPSYRVWERALFIEAADALERMGKEIEAVSAARVVCEENFLDEQEKAQARIAELEERCVRTLESDLALKIAEARIAELEKTITSVGQGEAIMDGLARIAELEGMLADCEEGLFKHHLDKRDARIAELEKKDWDLENDMLLRRIDELEAALRRIVGLANPLHVSTIVAIARAVLKETS
jgi:hypothetical protein